jgi:hypothetical protein
LATNAARFSFCVRAAIVGNAIAVSPAVIKPVYVSGAVLIGGTSRVRKDAWIIVTVSGNIAGAGRRLA